MLTLTGYVSFLSAYGRLSAVRGRLYVGRRRSAAMSLPALLILRSYSDALSFLISLFSPVWLEWAPQDACFCPPSLPQYSPVLVYGCARLFACLAPSSCSAFHTFFRLGPRLLSCRRPRHFFFTAPVLPRPRCRLSLSLGTPLTRCPSALSSFFFVWFSCPPLSLSTVALAICSRHFLCTPSPGPDPITHHEGQLGVPSAFLTGLRRGALLFSDRHFRLPGIPLGQFPPIPSRQPSLHRVEGSAVVVITAQSFRVLCLLLSFDAPCHFAPPPTPAALAPS